GSKAPLSAPSTIALLRTFVLQLGADLLAEGSLIAILEALLVLLPGERWIARRLAIACERTDANRARAAMLYRALIGESPLDVELLVSLERALAKGQDPSLAEGAEAIVRFLNPRDRRAPAVAPMSPIVERPPPELLDAHLFHTDVKSDLGTLLRITEDAIA